jgi:hypothetical protein
MTETDDMILKTLPGDFATGGDPWSDSFMLEPLGPMRPPEIPVRDEA